MMKTMILGGFLVGNKFMNKMWNLLGVDNEEDFDYDADYENASVPYTEEKENTTNIAPVTTKRIKLLVCLECNRLE